MGYLAYYLAFLAFQYLSGYAVSYPYLILAAVGIYLARRLRWLQAPHAAPPAGYYHPALIAHPVVVTNFREIYNDHIAAHIMAYVLMFARGMQIYFPQQLRREWSPATPRNSGVLHLPEATMLIVGVGGIGAETARLAGSRA